MENDDDVEHPFYYFVHDDAAAGVDDHEELLASLGFLLPPPPPPPPPPQPDQGRSAFAAYQSTAAMASSSSSSESLSRRYHSSASNVHRRMHRFLRSIYDDAGDDAGATAEMQPAEGEQQQAAPSGGSARFRHIMRERLRRERLSQGYADLQAILPTGASSSKVLVKSLIRNYMSGGKNTIVAAAANYIRELEGRKGWLCAQNELLERTTPKPGAGMVVKVRAESELGSTVDVFEAVLRRLKAMDELQVTAIQSWFGAGGMWMDVAVESKEKED
ncbi:Os01g0773800 [Oryza sativa Japonica Group]|uniref:Os01g0773800 protein n=1 Tax=Oryza sativa subsp. japonica TaxID=39947 RepID=Q5ZBY8_ORYSJ|nr:hypothetical protein [Oryza sativa Japonica Group]BAH91314.1 Os01g0773800 [Oryza sativa Japonica Group]|eukprot:NP_001172584.1 Os01g0773800 [Oryza sativa Japonica Group]